MLISLIVNALPVHWEILGNCLTAARPMDFDICATILSLQVPCHLFEGSSYFIRGLQTRDWIWCLLLQELLRVGNLVRNRICGNWFILPAFIGEMTWWIDNYRSIKRHLVVKCRSSVNDYTDTVSINYELLCLLMWSWYTLLFFYTQRDLTE